VTVPFPVEVAALGAPALVALTYLAVGSSAARLGAAGFNLLRLCVAVAGMGLAVLAFGSDRTLSGAQAGALALSAVVGLVLGDTGIYAALARIGPRRTGLLYATNGPMAAVLGYALLGEGLPPARLGGIALVVAGVWLAVAYRDAGAGRWEGAAAYPGAGVFFGLLGALGQAGGVLLARPVMAAGVDPMLAALVRLAAALVALLILAAAVPALRPAARPDARALAAGCVSGLLGTAAATSLVLLALRGGSSGVVATLASTTPVVLLVLLWIVSRKRPAAPAWVGAVLAVVGAMVLVLSPFS